MWSFHTVAHTSDYDPQIRNRYFHRPFFLHFPIRRWFYLFIFFMEKVTTTTLKSETGTFINYFFVFSNSSLVLFIHLFHGKKCRLRPSNRKPALSLISFPVFSNSLLVLFTHFFLMEKVTLTTLKSDTGIFIDHFFHIF